jgi:hypothetical protein
MLLKLLFLGFTKALCNESDGGSTSNLYINAYAVLENDTKFHVFATSYVTSYETQE